MKNMRVLSRDDDATAESTYNITLLYPEWIQAPPKTVLTEESYERASERAEREYGWIGVV